MCGECQKSSNVIHDLIEMLSDVAITEYLFVVDVEQEQRTMRRTGSGAQHPSRSQKFWFFWYANWISNNFYAHFVDHANFVFDLNKQKQYWIDFCRGSFSACLMQCVVWLVSYCKTYPCMGRISTSCNRRARPTNPLPERQSRKPWRSNRSQVWLLVKLTYYKDRGYWNRRITQSMIHSVRNALTGKRV